MTYLDMCKAAGFDKECTFEELRNLCGMTDTEFQMRLNIYSRCRQLSSIAVKGECTESREEHALMMVMWECEKKTWADGKWYSIEEGLEILEKNKGAEK